MTDQLYTVYDLPVQRITVVWARIEERSLAYVGRRTNWNKHCKRECDLNRMSTVLKQLLNNRQAFGVFRLNFYSNVKLHGSFQVYHILCRLPFEDMYRPQLFINFIVFLTLSCVIPTVVNGHHFFNKRVKVKN